MSTAVRQPTLFSIAFLPLALEPPAAPVLKDKSQWLKDSLSTPLFYSTRHTPLAMLVGVYAMGRTGSEACSFIRRTLIGAHQRCIAF